MPKKILFESAVHQLMRAGSRLQAELHPRAPADADQLARWLRSLRLEHPASGTMRIAWTHPRPGETSLDFKTARFYTRGDTPVFADQQTARGLAGTADPVMAANVAFFDAALRQAVEAARLFDQPAPSAAPAIADAARKDAEEQFHDDWAASEDLASIDVRKRNEACTAPEMRHLRRALGDLRGKTVLDVGCGLGEASVYLAMQGAMVTATDVSRGMCAAASRLAEANGVAIETHVVAAEDMRLGHRQFDVIHTANTLHHADIAATPDRLLPHLRPDGVFVSWDPVAYNPLINVYRRLATDVRTPDEHPLRLRDVRAIASRFRTCEVRWFWLTTLAVFLWMVVVQRRNPNRVRLWKQVIDDADRLAWLYRPLERLDRVLLECLPFLRPLCWNVVVIGHHPQPQPPAA